MTRARSHTRSARAVDQFLQYSRLGRDLGISRQLIEDSEFHGDTIVLRGEEVLNFGLCSYLGLGTDERLVEAGIDALRRYGNSYSSSSAYTALPLYGHLRSKLAEMIGAPVVVAGTTTLGHMSALPVLVREGDTVLIDALAHASLLAAIPSLQANGATAHQVPHNDVEAVARHADSAPGRTWYLLDGLYSMKGDTAPAEGLRALMDAHDDLWLYVDDAHGLGWSGTHGRGQFLERFGWHERLVMSFGLAKSFGTMGGVIATQDMDHIDLIEITGGPMVFGGPLPPSTLGASLASADIHLSDELPSLQQELLDRIDFVHSFADEIGLPLVASERTPLWFVEIGPAMSTISAATVMLRDGFFVNPAVFPAVPRGKGGIRFTVTRYLSNDQIASMLTRLNQVRIEMEGDDEIIDLTALEDREPASE